MRQPGGLRPPAQARGRAKRVVLGRAERVPWAVSARWPRASLGARHPSAPGQAQRAKRAKRSTTHVSAAHFLSSAAAPSASAAAVGTPPNAACRVELTAGPERLVGCGWLVTATAVHGSRKEQARRLQAAHHGARWAA